MIGNIKYRGLLYQATLLAAIFLGGYYLYSNLQANIAAQNIATGFDFLHNEAGFEISQSLIDYTAQSSYLKAILTGLLNTLLVASLGILLSIFIGTVIGMARLSTNWLLSFIATVYIEVLRNVPVLLQLFFWYAIFTENLPNTRNAITLIPGFHLSNKGLQIPALMEHPVNTAALIGFIIGVFFYLVCQKLGNKFQEKTGRPLPTTALGIGFIVFILMFVWFYHGMPIPLDMPIQSRFGFRGGATITPEFAAVLIGLTLYTSSFIAEIVRTGILSVSRGQTEAAAALGLSPTQTMRLVVLPQAMRVIIPPLTSQMLNLTKNSSLAVAVGYPDLVNVTQTTMNQTGQAIEAVLILMIVYLSISLSTSMFMNWYNHRVSLVERKS